MTGSDNKKPHYLCGTINTGWVQIALLRKPYLWVTLFGAVCVLF